MTKVKIIIRRDRDGIIKSFVEPIYKYGDKDEQQIAAYLSIKVAELLKEEDKKRKIKDNECRTTESEYDLLF